MGGQPIHISGILLLLISGMLVLINSMPVRAIPVPILKRSTNTTNERHTILISGTLVLVLIRGIRMLPRGMLVVKNKHSYFLQAY